MIRFVPIETPEPTPAPPRATTIYASTSFACDRDTRELGEDYPELKKIDRSYRLLAHRVDRARHKANARATVRMLTELDMLLADARHDVSWQTTLDEAKDAFAEARVVRIVRTR